MQLHAHPRGRVAKPLTAVEKPARFLLSCPRSEVRHKPMRSSATAYNVQCGAPAPPQQAGAGAAARAAARGRARAVCRPRSGGAAAQLRCRTLRRRCLHASKTLRPG